MDKTKSFHEIDTNQKYLTNINDYSKDKNNYIFYTGKYIKPQDLNSIKTSTSQELLQSLSGFSIEIQKNGNGIYVGPLQLETIRKKLINTLGEEKKEQAIPIHNIPYKRNIFNNLSGLGSLKKEKNISIESLHNLYQSIETLLDQDLSHHITQYKTRHGEFVVEDGYLYNPILHTQLKKILQKIHGFFDRLTPSQQNGILKNPARIGISNIRENTSLYLYDKYHKAEFDIYSYNSAIKNIEESFLKINNIIYEDEAKEGDNIVKSLEEDIRTYMGSITTQPQHDDEYQDICDDIVQNMITPFIENIDDEEIKKKCEIHFDDIEEEIINLLMTKQYKSTTSSKQLTLQQTTDVLSARYLFSKLVGYHNIDDEENCKSCIISLQACNEKELRDLLSPNELQELLEIIVEQDEFEFAVRIRDILQSE